MKYTKEIISEKEAEWRKGKTKAEIRRHLTKKPIYGTTYGLRPTRVERHSLLLSLLKGKEYTTKELNLLLPTISNKVLRIDLIYLENQGKISAKRKPNLVRWREKCSQ